METYGTAEIRRHEDGRLEVVHADPVIGISLELLAQAVAGDGLSVDGNGYLWLGGDPRYKYRPVRFEASVHGLGAELAVEGCRVLVCERVEG